jgi:UDP-N-acetylmuramate dehydrogenase
MRTHNLDLKKLSTQGIHIERDVLLGEFSTFGIGGKAKYFVTVQTIPQAQKIMEFCVQNQLHYHLLGKGSNSLFDDRGFDGLVIRMKIDYLDVRDDVVHVGAGFSFSLLGSKTARLGLKGLEFASGIPGSVGGAIYMNAGANGQETKDSLLEILWIDPNGRLCGLEKKSLSFHYRYSSFQKGAGIICGAVFCLKKEEGAKAIQKKYIDYRKATQPYSDLSIGCIFRNPEGGSAGALIEQVGLKNCFVGGATVSSIHANFIVNKGAAKAKDVVDLVEVIQEKVLKETGVFLQTEFCKIPFSLEEEENNV